MVKVGEGGWVPQHAAMAHAVAMALRTMGHWVEATMAEEGRRRREGGGGKEERPPQPCGEEELLQEGQHAD